ncbi:MAG: hypothetical protein J5685_05920 [Clostridiales bacterium]|nr:hypothetical protein [Clostridiales bacterium]
MKSLMNKSAKEIIFACSCLLLLIAIYLPYMTIIVEYNGKLNVREFAMFPSITGFLMLLISVGGVLMILGGHCKKVVFLGIGNAVIFMIRVLMDKSSAANFQHTIDMINQIENIMLNGNKESVVEWGYNSGYFFILMATILLLLVGGWCFLDTEKKEEEEEIEAEELARKKA